MQDHALPLDGATFAVSSCCRLELAGRDLMQMGNLLA